MQSEAEKLIEEVARAISKSEIQDEGGWEAFLPEAYAVTALIVERCAIVADKEAGKYLAGGIVFQSDAKGICRSVEAAIRSLSPEAPQPEAKESHHGE